MRFLLDTHLLIWVAISDPRLRPTVRAVLNDKANRFFFSVSSIWEIAIKSALKRRDFLYNPREIRRQFIENGYEELPILGHTQRSLRPHPDCSGDGRRDHSSYG
jgi:PIN domain nuclease of toxin-antitoxin system